MGGITEQAGGTADRDGAAVDRGGDPGAGGRREALGGCRGEPTGAGGVDHGAGQGVFTGMPGRRGEAQELVLVKARSFEGTQIGQVRGALGEGPGLGQRHRVDPAEAFRDHGGLDQDAVAAGVGHRRQQRRHRGQDDGAR